MKFIRIIITKVEIIIISTLFSFLPRVKLISFLNVIIIDFISLFVTEVIFHILVVVSSKMKGRDIQDMDKIVVEGSKTENRLVIILFSFGTLLTKWVIF
jgi:hypothetical protein